MTMASAIDMERSWYFPVCSNEEIDRILDVKNADDYLLKLRADAVVDNIRLWRVMRYRYQINEANWNFTRHFSTVEWDTYLQALSPDDFAKCVAIPRGFLFSKETEAFCLRSDYGDLAAVSEALRYFLFFMGLALLNVDEEVPNDVRQASILIAMRVMLQTETLDFDMDPRGLIPVSIESKLNGFVRLQLQFIIGHEFAHHLLAHHDINKTHKAHLFDAFNSHTDNSLATFYTVNQEQEFEADLEAILKGYGILFV
jgi:hypothetical protein